MALELYNGSDLIKDVYAGSQIISQIYKGGDLVWTHYPVQGVVFEKAVSGTYTFTPDVDGLYEVVVVGGGGGGAAQGDQPKYAWKSSAGAGGSGACVVAIFQLTRQEYSITVGSGGVGRGGGTNKNQWIYGDNGGSSSFSNYITCTGGGRGGASFTDGDPGRIGGAGGTHTESGYFLLRTASNGNTGSTATNYNRAYGGASLFGDYGKGGDAQATGYNSGWGNSGNVGYVRIRFLGSELFSAKTPGSYVFTPDVTGLYEVRLVGAGGGGASQASSQDHKRVAAGGGSGGYISATIQLIGGNGYNIVIGSGGEAKALYNDGTSIAGNGGDSTFGDLLTAGGGGGGIAVYNSYATGGSGGTNTYSDSVTVLTNLSGNTGGAQKDNYPSVSGGASKYSGYGSGGRAWSTGERSYGAENGSSGYIGIFYITSL